MPLKVLRYKITVKTFTYRNFLTRITDTITSKLPNIAATIISTIIDAFNTNNGISYHSLTSIVVEFVACAPTCVAFSGGTDDPYIFDIFDENSNKNSI